MPTINVMYKSLSLGLTALIIQRWHTRKSISVVYLTNSFWKKVLKCLDIVLPIIFYHACLGNQYLAYKQNHFPPYKPKQACQEQTSYTPPPRCYSRTLFKASIGFKATWFVWSLNHKCSFTSSHRVCQLSRLSFCLFKLVNDNEVLHGLPESFF